MRPNQQKIFLLLICALNRAAKATYPSQQYQSHQPYQQYNIFGPAFRSQLIRSPHNPLEWKEDEVYSHDYNYNSKNNNINGHHKWLPTFYGDQIGDYGQLDNRNINEYNRFATNQPSTSITYVPETVRALHTALSYKQPEQERFWQENVRPIPAAAQFYNANGPPPPSPFNEQQSLELGHLVPIEPFSQSTHNDNQKKENAAYNPISLIPWLSQEILASDTIVSSHRNKSPSERVMKQMRAFSKSDKFPRHSAIMPYLVMFQRHRGAANHNAPNYWLMSDQNAHNFGTFNKMYDLGVQLNRANGYVLSNAVGTGYPNYLNNSQGNVPATNTNGESVEANNSEFNSSQPEMNNEENNNSNGNQVSHQSAASAVPAALSISSHSS